MLSYLVVICSHMGDTRRPRLGREKKKQLRKRGWEHLNRTKAKRPDPIPRRHCLDLDDEEAAGTPLVNLEAYE